MAKVVKVVNVVADEDYGSLVAQLKTVNSEMAKLKKLDAELKGKITKGYFTRVDYDEEGNEILTPKTPLDNKGNSFFECTDFKGKPLILKRERKVSYKLNEQKAKEFFEKLGLLSAVTSIKIEFDEDAIFQLVSDEVISADDVESISDRKETYALRFIKAMEEDGEAY